MRWKLSHMWQLLKVLWGKVAGQLPSAPSKMLPDLLGKVPVQQPSPQKDPAAETTPKPTWEPAAPKVMAAQRVEEPRELLRSPDAEAGESGIGPAQPTSTAKSISNLWGMGDSGSGFPALLPPATVALLSALLPGLLGR